MRRALLVGIDQYDHVTDLQGCVADVELLRPLLERHADGQPNYSCRIVTSPGNIPITREKLRVLWADLFRNADDEVLFYFSGHGIPLEVGGYLVTQDGKLNDPGLPMNELVQMANDSSAREVLLILDCCSSGWAGNIGKGKNAAVQVSDGVTIIAASRSNEDAVEIGKQGVFTSLLVSALDGVAADLRGNISAAAIYAYTEQALGAWDQRPLYKSHASQLKPVRRSTPDVTDPELRRLVGLFPTVDHPYQLNKTYVVEEKDVAIPAHVEIFNLFKRYRDGRLLRIVGDLFWTAKEARTLSLSPLGRFYWGLAKKGLI